MTTTLDWLDDVDACGAALRWAEAQPDHAPAALVAGCARGDWLLWLADRVGYPAAELAATVRPAWLRAVRVHAAGALAAAGLAQHASRLRELPEDASASDVAAATEVAAAAASDVAAAASSAASWAAAASSAAAWAAAAARATATWEAADAAAWAAARAAREAALAAREAAREAARAASATWAAASVWEAAMAAAEAASAWASAWDAEHAQCAAEVRAALPDLAERWARALAGPPEEPYSRGS